MPVLKRKIPKHSYSGEMWTTNTANKKRLVIDFDHHCAYCDDKDCYNGGQRSYQVEHFAPESKFPTLKHTYENLLYACPYCNRAKWDKWISNNASVAVIGNEGFVSPCDDEYYKHLRRNADGTISATSELGKYIRNELNLFLKRHSIIYLLEEVDMRCQQLEERIKEEEKKGNDTTKLNVAYAAVAKELRQYYQLVAEENV